MKYLTLGLSISLFLLFYSIFIGKFPDKKTLKHRWINSGIPFVSSVLFFVLGTKLYFSPLAGLFCAIFGWQLPVIYLQKKAAKLRQRYKELSLDFISAASSMYGSNATTPKVIEVCAERLHEPFASELQEILALYKYQGTPIPDSIIDLAERYQLPELKAAGYIIKRSASGGGAQAASEGLMNLVEAVGKVNTRRTERIKNTYDSMLSSRAVLYFLLFGLVLNAIIPTWREANQQNSLVISVGCGLTLGFYYLIRKIGKSKDLDQI